MAKNIPEVSISRQSLAYAGKTPANGKLFYGSHSRCHGCCFRLILTGLFCLAMLTGCIQTSGPPLKRKVDKSKTLETYITLGNAYLQQGDRDLSRRNFEKALEIDKKSPEAHNGMGLFYQLTGETALAEKSYKKALSESKDYTAARVNYGIFLYRQQRYKEAWSAFELAATDLTYDRRALALTYVGQAAGKLGKTERARSAFEHSLSINPQLPLPMIELALMSFEDQDYATAKRYLDRYNDNAKASPKSLWLGIRIERIFGNKDREASYALALKNLHPYSREYLEYKTLLDQQSSPGGRSPE